MAGPRKQGHECSRWNFVQYLIPLLSYNYFQFLIKPQLNFRLLYQKFAMVTPILKKPSLDPYDLSNYRPVSNLSFISKIIERSIHSQMNKYLEDHNLLPTKQSAYRSSIQLKLLYWISCQMCTLLLMLAR